MSTIILSTKAKVLLGIVLLVLLITVGAFMQRYAYIDFTNLKFALTPNVTGDINETASSTSSAEPLEEFPKRDKYLNEARASQYLSYATRDYFNGSYDEALRRLERAKWYDPQNFEVFKLSGQIQFERSQYRKAFNDWARATQIPNKDQSLLRDIDVLKRLIRYCRNEIDRLQRIINRNPEDRLSAARLKELESRIAD